jgi:hypothetical protein
MGCIEYPDMPADVVPDKCRSCDGHCCKIYADHDHGGGRPWTVWFEEWCENWLAEFAATEADKRFVPLFDPLEVHMGGNEHMLADLRARGIDPDSCQYRGQSGCLLPREFRPKVCRLYVCKEAQ